MNRLNIFLEDSVHTKLKIMAVLQKKTLKDLIRDLIEKDVKRDLSIIKDVISEGER